MSGPEPPGSGSALLSGQQLRSLLTENGRIFRPGTWSTSQLRGAGYDLRIATDLMVIPMEPGGVSHTTYERGEHRNTDVILAPGDTALFSSFERFSFDFDVCGNIGAKFSLAAKGLLILTGLAVDPGYGREQDSQGAWKPMEDQRLHFLVANVGPESVALRPGVDAIAFLQLFHIPTVSDRHPSPSRGFEALREQLFDRNSATGLAYFRNVRDAREEVKVLANSISVMREDVDKIQNASNTVLVFGVFLVAATLLGVLANFLVESLSNLPEDAGTVRTVAALTVAGVYSIAVVILTVISIHRARR